jgi:hypothetical protein
VVVRGPAPGGVHPAGPARPHGTNLLDLKPGLCPGPERDMWQTAWAEIIQDKATPQAAAEKAFKRVEEIFSKYPIAQT